MARLLLFMFPALMDLVFGGSRFVCLQRMGNDPDAANTSVAMILTIFAVGYILAAKGWGYVVTPRNAAGVLVGSCLAVATLAGGLIVFDSLWSIYPLMFCFGIALSSFFVPFQVFMKSVSSEDGSGLARSTALYTGSWSLGIAAGPFLGGFIWKTFGWQWCHGLSAAVAVACAVGIHAFARTHGRRAHAELGAAAEAAQAAGRAPANPYSAMPDLARWGWICCGAGFIGMLMLLSVLPKLMAGLGLGEDLKGVVMAQLNLTQSATAFVMVAGRTWMYRPRPVLLMGGLGAASLAVFAAADGAAALLAASAMFGVYAGMYCMCFVFYSLVHPTRSSRYLAMNETIVGVCTIVGPLLGGLAADALGPRAAFILCGVLVAAAVAVHAWILHARCRGHLAELKI